MKIRITNISARAVIVTIEGGGKYRSGGKLTVNGSEYFNTVNYIDGLKPVTKYTAVFEQGGETMSETFTTAYEFVTLDVREFGAKGDGETDDTAAIQAAIMCCPHDSRVLLTGGTYKVTNIFLKSNIVFEIAEGASLLADNIREHHSILPGMITSYDEKDEYNLGTWEGNPLKSFAGIITGIDVENIVICGRGTVFGNATHQDWWHDEKRMNIAFRPRLLFLSHCKNVVVAGLLFKNSPSWTIHPYFSKNVKLIDFTINNPADSPNTDGIDVESCSNVEIAGIHFHLGDDCIAIKSGKIYMGRKYHTPVEHIHIHDCLCENGHGAVTVGSEISGGVDDVVVENCLFVDTDRGLRIKTRRGRGKLSVIDGVVFRNIEMKGVKTPFVANAFYFCDPDGRTSYVQDRAPHPVDDTTPKIKRLVFEDITAVDCHYAAAFFMGLPESPIEVIEMKNVDIRFHEHPESGYAAMLCGIEPMSGYGIFAENVEKLILDNVTIDETAAESPLK
ncbi:MAG: glycoside hydrolase family 28 protein [Oscillospiraceae bacterium]|nr:glycoside hydrolase family 28 protein [Oscillospiraceae bacterium]